MRWLVLVVCLGGCYRPNFGSPSFYCHEEDVPACPDGQKCVDGRCSDPSALASSAPDAASGWSDNDGGTTAPADLASEPPPDLLMCVANGGHCGHQDSVCCSKWCDYTTGNCIKHP